MFRKQKPDGKLIVDLSGESEYPMQLTNLNMDSVLGKKFIVIEVENLTDKHFRDLQGV